MSNKLSFSLVSPERELFSGDVDEVVIPGSEGDIGVLAAHAPLMTTLIPGMLVIKNDGTEKEIYVKGGFADITPAGLTVLAEMAVPVDELTSDLLARERKQAEEDVSAEDINTSYSASRVLQVLADR